MKTSLWIIVGVVIVGAGVLWYLGGKQSAPSSVPTTPTRITTQTETPLPTAPSTRVETATLVAVGKFTGTGTATRSFDGTTFTLTVTATLPDPKSGKFYEGWLVRKQPSLLFFSTGKLTKQGGQYVATYTAGQNYPEYRGVVVTEETLANGLDGKPETHVLEGAF
ncbi:hypothetical protein HY086_03995 [Candidatus Gottesmanbacteria bacterium]|nr:hypothetical protein [Candidatus Gottesmanbacteria bacterium]